jgi:hypothetical protein
MKRDKKGLLHFLQINKEEFADLCSAIALKFEKSEEVSSLHFSVIACVQRLITD